MPASMKMDSGLEDNGLAVNRQQLHEGREHGLAQVRAGPDGKDDALCELASFRMSFIIMVALKLFDRQLLGKLTKLCIELRKTNAQPKADNKQDEDEEQENEVRRRHGADKIGKPEKHLGENASKQKKSRETKPEQRILKTHLGIANLNGHITKGKQGRCKQRNTKRERHATSPSNLLRKN